MEKPTLRALLLAAAVVAPNFVAPATQQQAPMKHAEEFSSDELRNTLRAMNGTTYQSEPLKEVFDESEPLREVFKG
jgi:hypothetical protein